MTNNTATSPAAQRLDRFYQALRRPGITRPTRGRWFTGVAAALANRAGIDPMIVRLAFVLGSLFFGVGVAAYLVLWLLLPAEDGTLRIERALSDGDVPSIILLVVATLSVVGPGAPFGFHSFGLVVAAAVVAWYLTRHRGAPTDGWRVEPTTPAPDDAPRG